MPSLPVPFADIKATAEAWHEALAEGYSPTPRAGNTQPSALRVTARRVGFNTASTSSTEIRLDTAVALGIPVREWRLVDPSWVDAQILRYRQYDEDFRAAEMSFGRAAGSDRGAAANRAVPPSPRRSRLDARAAITLPSAPPSGRVTATDGFGNSVELAPSHETLVERIIPALRRMPHTLDALAAKLGAPVGATVVALHEAMSRGASIHLRGDLWHLDAPAMGSQSTNSQNPLQLVSDERGVIRFGAVGDTHLGSKYERLDCLEDYYDHLAHRGIHHVLHAGNWIDGEAPFNRHDLLVHGMDQQMQYLAKHYPRREGVETWAITGEDHEGWYSRREGIDVGRYAERVMQDAGRTDWRDVGFMENFIDLVHAGTGKSSKLLLMHPGGGSAYAVSYAPQKIVEGFDGGDKPAVLLIGHYHKSSYNLIRNVHTFQVGCFQDQTVFMRKNKLSSHLGGWFIEIELDPETGAVHQAGGYYRNYFVKDYYRGRWSQHGSVNHAPRGAA